MGLLFASILPQDYLFSACYLRELSRGENGRKPYPIKDQRAQPAEDGPVIYLFSRGDRPQSRVFSSVFYLLADDIIRPEHDLAICTMAADHSPADPDDDKDQLAILPGLFFLQDQKPDRRRDKERSPSRMPGLRGAAAGSQPLEAPGMSGPVAHHETELKGHDEGLIVLCMIP